MGLPGYLWQLFRDAPSKRRLARSLALGGRGGDRTVTSADGTSLSARRCGDGDPVVLVHGMLDGIGAFSLVELTLAETRSVWVYDRRGRGGSGDRPDRYGLEREIEDLQAVLDAAGSPSHVVGHSFGALVVLAAAADGTGMRSMTLYEPPVRTDRIDRDLLDRVTRLVQSGEHERAIHVAALDIAGVSEEELGIARRVRPVWNQLLDALDAVPRELDLVSNMDWNGLDLPVRDRPAMVISGGRDSSPVYPRPEDLPRFVAEPEIETLPGQGHMAITFAPDRFAEVVLDFIDRH